jgi:peptidoglycan/LPS O-acetylase OafA/YrhL
LGLFFHYIYTGPKSDEIARQFPGQLSYFLIGSIFSVNKILLSKIGILTILSAFLFIINKNYVVVIIFEPIFYSCITIWLSTSAFRNINIAKFCDISYGIYLFLYPIIQFFIYIGVFNYNIWLGLSGVVCASVIISLISWHLIEKRFLKRSSHYVAAAM